MSLFKFAEITLGIKVGDIMLAGKFKNQRMVVKDIGVDKLGQPTINGKTLLAMRIEKNLPFDKRSKKTKDESTDKFKKKK